MSVQPISETLSPPAAAEKTNLIGSEQWDASWATTAAPIRLRPWRDYLSWRFCQVFREYIHPGSRVLEVGCGGSRFLPYFAKDLGAEVWGFDFAPAGVNSARAALRRAGADGTILQADLFDPAGVPLNYFDVVFSGGFIEHFPDTVEVLRHITRFARKGTGLVITEVPNVGGWFFSKLQKWIDPELYHQHVILKPAQMEAAHDLAGAQPIQPTQYFGTICLGVVSYNRLLRHIPGPVATMLKRSIEIPQVLLTAPFWLCRTKFESATLSPFVLGVYQRTGD